MACLEAGGAAPCTSNVGCIDSVTQQPCTSTGGASTGGTGGGQYTNPNYWSAWNNTLGSLGSALGSWSNLITGNVQPTYYQDPRQQQSNTLIYVGMGVLFLVMMVVLYVSLKNK